jgi:hypothetical protein
MPVIKKCSKYSAIFGASVAMAAPNRFQTGLFVKKIDTLKMGRGVDLASFYPCEQPLQEAPPEKKPLPLLLNSLSNLTRHANTINPTPMLKSVVD